MRSQRILAFIFAAACACASPALGQVFMVTSNADNGSGTLRTAITQANAFNGTASINFSNGLGTIQPTSALPSLTNSNGVTINGNGDAVSGPAGNDASVTLSMNGPPIAVGATGGVTAFTVSAGNLTTLAETTINGGNAGNDNVGAIALGATDNLLGGAGVSMQSSGTLTNGGSIAGGTGGASPSAGSGGNGGAGVVASIANATVNNSGIVAGGVAGSGQFGGTGGTGMQLTAFGFAINSGTVSGANGGQGNIGPGGGGTAIGFSAGGSLINTGTITGGSGVASSSPVASSNGGNSVSISGAGSVTNSGTITAGSGGNAGFESAAGSAGAAIAITGGVGTFTNQNHGAINGNVTLDNFANNVTLQIGSTINGNLNVGTSSSAVLAISDVGGASNSFASITGALSLSGKFIINVDGTASGSYGQIAVGQVALGQSTLQFNLNAALSDGETLQIITTTQPISGTFSNAPNGAIFNIGAFGGLEYYGDVNYTTNTVELDDFFTEPVPEPASIAGMFIAAVGTLLRRRRRR